MDAWKSCQLGDIFTFQRGHDLPKKQMVSGEYPVVGSNGIIGYHNEYTTESPSITIGRSGNTGNPFIVYGRSWSHNTTLYIKEFKGSDPVYVYYLLKTLDLGNFAGGSAVPTLNRNHIHTLEISVPPLSEQVEIGNSLRAMDDKIASNTKINHHLEQMAQAIFKSWFVDFEVSKPFTEVVRVLGGGTPKTGTAEYWNGEIPFFTPKDALGTYALTTEKTLTEAGLSNCNSRLYPINTVFVTARGTVGKLALAGCPMAMNQSCYALAGTNGYGQHYVYHLAQYVVESLKHKASGAIFDAIVTRDFESEIVPALTVDEANSFEEKVVPIYEAILNNSKENLRLTEFRDTLLPRLMSGELPVADLVSAK